METVYISASEAAQVIGLTKRRINQLVAEGEIQAARIGNVNAVERASLNKYITKNGHKGGRPKKLDK